MKETLASLVVVLMVVVMVKSCVGVFVGPDKKDRAAEVAKVDK